MSYRSKTGETVAEQQEEEYFGPCQVCRSQTNKKALANYGTRCFRCYEAYVREHVPKGPPVDRDKHGDRAWAYALKAREEAGISLTGDQKTMWRAALRGAA